MLREKGDDLVLGHYGVIGGPHGAAALLGIKRTTLQARVQKLGLAAWRPRKRGHRERGSGSVG
jgi:hypothetical protein